eukprot:TRINITY_DN6457_c0_g1_i1.p3 TRINITY_DN6457_c0_g1~~TRINITY_DN6457_c0_g1_i1.p3  ORF type:complete len:103 (-),score=9.60 TRINITY_DN6457_c0_g1_i1:65-373(-)
MRSLENFYNEVVEAQKKLENFSEGEGKSKIIVVVFRVLEFRKGGRSFGRAVVNKGKWYYFENLNFFFFFLIYVYIFAVFKNYQVSKNIWKLGNILRDMKFVI